MSAAEVVANGISTTPSQVQEPDTTLPPAKRKRASTEEDVPQLNGTSEPSKQSPPAITKDVSFLDLLADVSTVLSNYDTSPSILTFDVTTELKKSSTSSEPTAKRTKFNQDAPVTIVDKLKQGHYTDLDALVKDVGLVAKVLLAPIKAKDVNVYPSPYGRPNPLSAHETRLWNAVLAFQKVLEDIVRAEKSRVASKEAAKNGVEKPAVSDATTPEVAIKTEVLDGEVLQNGKPVLTVFANAPGPRQLFSSFQQPVNVSGKVKSKDLNASVEVVAPLRESGLPNFISTTKIPSLPLDDDDTKSKKASTIGALFAPPATLPKLQPPKPSKKLTTTGNTITFVPLDQPVRSNRRNSYNWCAARLSVGQWLGYGGVDSPQEPTSPQAKRKQRDRTLSTGEAFLAPSLDEKEAQQRAQEDALFRKVYGSFAPNHDDSGALVPQETRNEIWWNKISDRFAQASIAIDPALLEPEVEEIVDPEKEEATIKEAVESFDPVALGLDKLEEEAKEAKEVEEMLGEISSLLETLSSYQRIRNSSLATSSRTTVGQNNPLTDLMGSPSTPSTAEMEVYKTLKLQLALLVNSLPPYAVARLNGDQLEELNIKTSIVVESENPRGVMTEDEAARVLKQQAYAATAAPPVAPLHRAGSSGTYGNYNATPSQYAAHGRTPVAPAAAAARPAAPAVFYPPQSQARPAPIPYQRSGGGVQTYSGGYPTTTPRPAYTPQAYAQTTPRPSNYNASNSLQNIYNITGQKTNYTQSQPTQQQHYQGTPTAQRQAYAQPPASSSTYQARPPPTAPMYNYTASQTPQARTASPLTTSASIPPPQYSQPRPAYGTTTTGPPQQNSSYYRPPVSQGGQPYTGQQFPQQQQQRLAAPPMGTSARQASGTPQPPTPAQNGGYAASGQVNGTPAPVAVHQS